MKVAIIGAGTIGLYLGKELQKRGVEVFIFEKRKEIGKKVCSGLFSERILDFVPESEKIIEKEINGCLIHFPKKTIQLDFEKKFFLIDHVKLDNLLFNLAQNLGVKIFLGSEIKKLPENFDKIIGCDGANSKIRKILKLKTPDFFLGIQAFEEKTENQNFVETWPTQNGFLWKIPRKNVVEYGIYEKPKIALENFKKFLLENSIKTKQIQSTLIAQGLSLPKNENITLCGEALGLTKPWSGGGVIWGLVAANFLLECFPDFKKYQKKVSMFFKREIAFSKFLKKIVYFLGFSVPYFLPKKVKIDGDFFFKKKLDF